MDGTEPMLVRELQGSDDILHDGAAETAVCAGH